MNPVSITLLTVADADAVGALLQAQLREHDIVTPANDVREVIHSVIANSSLGFMLLASVDGRAVGVAYVAAHLSVEHGGTIGWLEELYVLPGWRSSGVGSRLLAEVIARARQLGWRCIELEIVAGHERAASLYGRHAFRPVARARFTRSLRGERSSDSPRG